MRIRYDEGCLAVHTLNVTGDRWALLVVRELMFAPKRFQAIRGGMPGITASVLSQRLNQLIAAGVVRQIPSLGAYALTDSGRGLLPVLQALCRWGARHPGHDPRRFISPAALMISMTAMLDRVAVPAQPLTAGFRSGHENFMQRLEAGSGVRVEAVDEIEAPFVLEGNGNQLARAVYGATPIAALAGQGLIRLDGDADAAQTYVDLFRLRR